LGRILAYCKVVLAAVVYTVACSAFTMPPKDRLVTDFASVLDVQQISALEQRLVAFSDSTSNQILVVIYPELENDNEAWMAQQIGEQMGVGQQKYNNGVVMLVKAKMNPSDFRAAFIATGYGVEGALPDALCSRITRERMVPFLKQDNYYAAIESGLDALMPILAGEISTSEFAGKEDGDDALVTAIVFLLIFVVIVILIVFSSGKGGDGKGGNGGGGGKMSTAERLMLLGLLSRGGRRSSGNWGGGFSGGSFGGGGFGGFGGGHFGGGGGGSRC